MRRKARILILCKTYPSPSAAYTETSCVAGMDEAGNLIRLYPVPFRLVTDDQRFSKDRVPGSGVTEPAEGALRAKEDGHRGSWLTLSLRRPNTHQRNHDDQAHYRIDRVG